MFRPLAKFVALATCSAVSLAAPAARAVDCAGLPSPVYIVGSSAAKPFLAEIAKVLVIQKPAVTIAYLGQGSCVGVSAILSGSPITGTLTYWDTLGAEQSCSVPSSSPVIADIGASDVFATTCSSLPGGLPSNIGDFLGPVQPMTFVVPKASTQLSISAEAAYFIYGFGADSGAAPWTNEDFILQRDDLSGTQRMIARAIGVEPSRWRGVHTTSSADMKTKVTSSLNPEATIGVMSTDVAQESRATLNVLAYQHFGQSCGYFPDQEETSNEKRNVRDGHYAIWGPLHLLTVLNKNGYPQNSQASDIIGFMTGTKAPPMGLDLIALEAARHVVPQCAMRVKRTEEIGPLASFAPPESCGCYYDKVANGTTSCTPCVSKTECPATAPTCSYGYCESY